MLLGWKLTQICVLSKHIVYLFLLQHLAQYFDNSVSLMSRLTHMYICLQLSS